MQTRFTHTLIAGAAVLGLGWQAPAAAALVTYEFGGSIDSVRCGPAIDCGANGYQFLSGGTFSGSMVWDTSARRITEFSYSFDRLLRSKQFAGSGGFFQADGVSFFMSLGGGSYTQADLDPDSFRIELDGPASAFSGFVDGFPTAFDLGAMTFNRSFWRANSSRPDEVDLSLTLRSLTADAPPPPTTVPEPATAALAGLAGLAALRASRRRAPAQG